MNKWNEFTESGIYLFVGGLLVLLVNGLMFGPITNQFYEDHTLLDKYPAGSFEIIAFYYITLVIGAVLVIFGLAKLVRGLRGK